MILRHNVTILNYTTVKNSEGMSVKTWSILKTIQADVQPRQLSENEVKLFGLSSQQSNAKNMYFYQDGTITEGMRVLYDGSLFEIRGDNDWSIHSVVILIPVLGETYTPLLPIITYFSPLSGSIGDTFYLNGFNFVGVTKIEINRIQITTYTIISSTQILCTIPLLATSGTIKITTTTGNDTSDNIFTVTP